MATKTLKRRRFKLYQLNQSKQELVNPYYVMTINTQAIGKQQQRLNLLVAQVERLKKEQQSGSHIYKGIMKGVSRALSFMDVPSKKSHKVPKIDLNSSDYANDFFNNEYESLWGDNKTRLLSPSQSVAGAVTNA